MYSAYGTVAQPTATEATIQAHISTSELRDRGSVRGVFIGPLLVLCFVRTLDSVQNLEDRLAMVILKLWGRGFSDGSVTKWANDVDSPVEEKHEPRRSNASQHDIELALPTTALAPTTSRSSKLKFAQLSRRERLVAFLRRIGTATAPTRGLTSSNGGRSSTGQPIARQRAVDDADDGEVDEVVVDADWDAPATTSSSSSILGPVKNPTSQSSPDLDLYTEAPEQSVLINAFLKAVWETRKFFGPTFHKVEDERRYRLENWYAGKRLATWSSLFPVLTWIFGIVFVPTAGPDVQLMDKIWFWGLAPVLSVPIPYMVLMDWPRDRPKAYQTFLCISVWMWSFYTVLFIGLCGFYDPTNSHFTCGKKDFMATFYYTTGLQVIGLFGLFLNRFAACIGAIAWLCTACALIIPDRPQWGRYIINFVLFQLFVLWVHYMAELGERRLYTLREQLQVQYRHTQKAQNNERKAWESRKRVTSYVFHEVRVPLNTALLAAQNMEAGMIIDKEHEIDFRALEGSLSVMSNVLNDVLDFNRMDSGRFESASKPYAFHAVMRSLFIPLGLVAKARGLELVTDLDHNIDFVARRATLEAEGQHPADVSEQMKLFPDGDGIVQGDETRLRQIINNLASNAAKFTPSGGRITITTKLILPSDPFTEESVISSNATTYTENSLSTTRLSQHNLAHQKPVVAKELDRIVVRIEVADTGSGIRPSDMENCNLFSAFNQTELGRQQGGKGTGLGLALVRNIVKLSGGRLGVKSVYGQGATFWVEMPLGVGMAAKPPMSSYDMVVQQMQQDNDRAATDSPTNGTNGGDSMSVSAEASVTRSTSAINGLMDQGGRVELMLSNHQYSTRQLGEMTAGLANPSHTIHEEDIGDHHQANTPDESSLTTASKQQRPTFVQLPGPNNFALEPSSTPSSSSDSPCDLPPGVSIYGMIGAAVAPTNGGGSSSSWRGSNGTSSSSATSPFEGLEVLVVDDDLMTRMMMNRLLTRLGCRVTLAENGQVALDLITAPPPPASPLSIEETPILETPTTTYDGPSRFAIVFLDNQMPVMHGILAVRNLRRLRGRKDFVVGVTGNALLVDQEEYLQAGVDHVLTKPVREPSLKSMLMIADERQKNALAQPDP